MDGMTRRDFLGRLARVAGFSAVWKYGGYETAADIVAKVADRNGSITQRIAAWLSSRWW